jgi:hypothetical protein
MLKTKILLSIMLLSILATTLIPITSSAPDDSMTFNLQIAGATNPPGQTETIYWKCVGDLYYTNTFTIPGTLDYGALDCDEIDVKIQKDRHPHTLDAEATANSAAAGAVVTIVGNEKDIPTSPFTTLPIPNVWFRMDPGEVTVVYDQAGPKIDVLQFNVIPSPADRLVAMQAGTIDVSTQLTRSGDIDKLYGDGFTLTVDPGFHVCFAGFNIRPDISPIRRGLRPRDRIRMGTSRCKFQTCSGALV